MTEDFRQPYGWKVKEGEQEYGYGEAKFAEAAFGDNVNDIKPNPKGGEDDYHSRSVDPDGPFGAAKTGDPDRSGYGNNDEYKPESGDSEPSDTGTLDLPIGHMVVEDGQASGRNYYLVLDLDTKKFYTVVPDYKDGKQYKSPMKADRTSALADAYRAVSANLPDSVLAQLRQRFPETPAVESL
jgi:hypothetical protein